MLSPLIIGLVMAFTAAGGIGVGTHGVLEINKASGTIKTAKKRYEDGIKEFEKNNKITAENMDELGKIEMGILSSFQKFSDIIEKIQNKPDFKEIKSNFIDLPNYDREELSKVSIGAGLLLAGISGVALGTAGGFAAAGATTAAVMAFGTASTGTAIATLSGAAATNATLAALGGGAIAAGGGGMALGSTILGVTSAGVGILVGGFAVGLIGSFINKKAEKTWDMLLEAEANIKKICVYLNKLNVTSIRYAKKLSEINSYYLECLEKLDKTINSKKKNDWTKFTDKEKLLTMDTILLVQLLYKMCQIQIVLSGDADEINTVNIDAVNENLLSANKMLEERGLAKKINEKQVSRHNDYSKDEMYCIGTVALLYYFARCDGNVSDQEDKVISEVLREVHEKYKLSENALEEIEIIKKEDPFTFMCFKKYLDNIDLECLDQLGKIIYDVVSASEGITAEEITAQIDFENYLGYRRLVNKNQSL